VWKIPTTRSDWQSEIAVTHIQILIYYSTFIQTKASQFKSFRDQCIYIYIYTHTPLTERPEVDAENRTRGSPWERDPSVVTPISHLTIGVDIPFVTTVSIKLDNIKQSNTAARRHLFFCTRHLLTFVRGACCSFTLSSPLNVLNLSLGPHLHTAENSRIWMSNNSVTVFFECRTDFDRLLHITPFEITPR